MDNEQCVRSPVFLHFMNREIWETENTSFSDEYISNLLVAAALSTTSYIYLGFALVIEDLSYFPESIKLLLNLERFGYARFVSDSPDISAFLEDRQRLYRKSKHKYSFYFSSKTHLPIPTKSLITYQNTTRYLHNNLLKTAIGETLSNVGNSLASRTKDIVLKRLSYQERTGLAITKDLFSKPLVLNRDRGAINRIIILLYNNRYCDEFEGHILTGIKGLSYYDQFESASSITDVRVLLELYFQLGILDRRKYASFEYTIFFKTDSYFQSFVLEVQRFLSGCMALYHSIHMIIQLIHSSINPPEKPFVSCQDALLKLWRCSMMMNEKEDRFRDGYEEQSTSYSKVLILAASVLEYRVLRKCLTNAGYHYVDRDIDSCESSYAECTNRNGVVIYIARSGMGDMNAAHTLQVLENHISPDYVFYGGICVGLRKKSQHLSQILIARTVHDYNLAKVSAGRRIGRGTTVSTSRFLYDKCILEAYNMADSDYDEGLIISANILLNDQDLVKELVNDKPDAIGYDMEGAGLSFIGSSIYKKWILVKAISDWGFGKRDDSQEVAASASFNFIINVIEHQLSK